MKIYNLWLESMLHKVYEPKDFFLDMELPLSNGEMYQRIIKIVDRSKFWVAKLEMEEKLEET